MDKIYHRRITTCKECPAVIRTPVVDEDKPVWDILECGMVQPRQGIIGLSPPFWCPLPDASKTDKRGEWG